MSELNNIASSLPVLGGFFSSDEQDEAKRRLQDLLDNYKGPESDPRYRAELEQLQEQAKGGLTAADRAAMLDQYDQASQFAHGRQGAIEQNQQMRGGGAASSGQSAVLQAQAAQDGASRLQHAGMEQNAIASNRAMQARQAFLDTLARNQNAMNQYKMAATGGYVNYLGGVDDARKASVNQGAQIAAAAIGGPPGAAAAGATGKTPARSPQMAAAETYPEQTIYGTPPPQAPQAAYQAPPHAPINPDDYTQTGQRNVQMPMYGSGRR